jgi:hypothetical protein
VTLAVVQEALNIVRGAVMIVYPMGLPPYDPIRMEMENTEELEGTQVKLFQWNQDIHSNEKMTCTVGSRVY